MSASSTPGTSNTSGTPASVKILRTDISGENASAFGWRRHWRFYLFALPFTLIWLIPIFGTILTSLRSKDDVLYNGYLSLPKPFTLAPYIEAWQQGNISGYLLNSFLITLPALFGALFLSSLAAYALARLRFRGSRLILMMYVTGMMLPFQIIILPVFQLSIALRIYNTLWAVIAVHTAFQMAFCTFVLRNFMRTLPGEILESARIDGCPEFGIYRRIVLPLTLPALAALATLEFTWIFNDFIWSLVLLQDNNLRPVTAGLATLIGQYNTDWNVVVAGSLMASVPTIIVFILLQRYFIQGLTLGAVK